MKIVLNGEAREIEGIGSVADLIRDVRAGKGRVAVLVNDDVVLAVDRETHLLTEGDRIEIIAFAAGG
ncbi:MAG: sulfur carrier protein ThiS [Lentisphaeria bacterium]|nr:sulfur carrier protein ThiS [Lentisphaeria bacterium]